MNATEIMRLAIEMSNARHPSERARKRKFLESAVRELEQRAERAEKDAERYRWLLDKSNAIDWDADIRVPPMSAEWWETATGGDQLDAAIDAALKDAR